MQPFLIKINMNKNLTGQHCIPYDWRNILVCFPHIKPGAGRRVRLPADDGAALVGRDETVALRAELRQVDRGVVRGVDLGALLVRVEVDLAAVPPHD